MTRSGIGSYEEARQFSLEVFSRLSPAKKLRWLSDMAVFIDAANPEARRHRFGWLPKRRARRQ